MLKLTSIIMGTLAAATLAQPTLAATNPSSFGNPVVTRPADNLQAQLIIKIGDTSRSDDRYRYSDRERYERERWEAKRRRYYEHREYRERYRERYDDRRDYYRH
jgi:cobyric acid synthase